MKIENFGQTQLSAQTENKSYLEKVHRTDRPGSEFLGKKKLAKLVNFNDILKQIDVLFQIERPILLQ